MEQFKKDNYFKETGKILDVLSLNANLSEFVFKNLLIDLKIPESNKNIFANIDNSCDEKIILNAINTNNGFKYLLREINSTISQVPNQLFLIWNNEMVDLCTKEILISNWESIWYGEGDEALIIYIPNLIVLIIHYWGEVGIKKINN